MAKELPEDASIEKITEGLARALSRAKAESKPGGRFANVGWDELHDIVQTFIVDLYTISIQESEHFGAKVATDADVRRAKKILFEETRRRTRRRGFLSAIAGVIVGATLSAALSILFTPNSSPVIVAVLFLLALAGVVTMVWSLQ